jgi:hypothetical protein
VGVQVAVGTGVQVAVGLSVAVGLGRVVGVAVMGCVVGNGVPGVDVAGLGGGELTIRESVAAGVGAIVQDPIRPSPSTRKR